MIAASCTVALACILAAVVLNVYRLAAGPGTLDRVLALDTLVVNTIALIVVTGIWYGTAMYFEAALLFAMVGFLSTAAFCKFLLRGNVIE